MIEPASGPHPGAISDLLPATVITRTNVNGTLQFGDAIYAGPTISTASGYGSASAGVFLGIVVKSPAATPANGRYFTFNEAVSILTKGAIWLRVPAGAGADPAYRDELGNFTPVADGNTSVPNASFIAGCEPGGMAILKLS